MKQEELEYLLSQYIDGLLSDFDRARVDELLASSAEAREILAEYQALNGALRASPGVPNLDWEKVHASIRANLADAEVPVRNYKIDFAIWSRRLAAAATVAILVGLSWTLVRNYPMGTTPASLGRPVVQVSGPQVEFTSLPPVSNISIGPASESVDWSVRYEETQVSRPGRVVIATGSSLPQDTTPTY